MDDKQGNAVATRPRGVTQITAVLLIHALGLAVPGLAYVVGLFIYTGYPPTLFCVAGLLLLPSLALMTVAIQFYRLKRWTYPIARRLIGPGWSGLSSLLGLANTINRAAVRQAFGLPPLPEDTPYPKMETRQ